MSGARCAHVKQQEPNTGHTLALPLYEPEDLGAPKVQCSVHFEGGLEQAASWGNWLCSQIDSQLTLCTQWLVFVAFLSLFDGFLVEIKRSEVRSPDLIFLLRAETFFGATLNVTLFVTLGFLTLEPWSP